MECGYLYEVITILLLRLKLQFLYIVLFKEKGQTQTFSTIGTHEVNKTFFYECMFPNFQQSYGPWTLKISIC